MHEEKENLRMLAKSLPRTPESRLPLDQQESLLNELSDAVGLLENRLVMVLGPERPSAEAEGLTEDALAASPLTQQLFANNDRLKRASRRLSELLERLEV